MAQPDRPTLTTTSYAILGQLAMRPWTMYELARHMRQDVHHFFPRAESQVYAEPKRLVALGLVTSHAEATGRRRRTVYQITDAGRAALADWLALPPSRGPLLEFEGLLRVFLAQSGSVEDLLKTLGAIRQEADRVRDQASHARDAIRDGSAGVTDQPESQALVHDFLEDFSDLVRDWAERSEHRVRDWRDLDEGARRSEALELLRKIGSA